MLSERVHQLPSIRSLPSSPRPLLTVVSCSCLLACFPPRGLGGRFTADGKHSVSNVCVADILLSLIRLLSLTCPLPSPESVTQHLSEFLKHLRPQLRGSCVSWEGLMCWFEPCCIIIHSVFNYRFFKCFLHLLLFFYRLFFSTLPQSSFCFFLFSPLRVLSKSRV